MSTKLFVFTLLLTLLLGTLAGCTTMHQGAMPMAEMAATDAPPQPEPGKLTIVDVRGIWAIIAALFASILALIALNWSRFAGDLNDTLTQRA